MKTWRVNMNTGETKIVYYGVARMVWDADGSVRPAKRRPTIHDGEFDCCARSEH